MKNVTVIIPNYNHAPYLEQRIQSVLDQSYQNFEVILLDDCSTDSSKEIINRYKGNHKITHVFFNEKNSGSPFGLWRYGIEKANGKYIWIAESDDWADKEFLTEIVSVLENTDAVIAHSHSFLYLNEKLKLNDWWDSFYFQRWDSNYVEQGTLLLKEYGRYKCPVINVSSAVFKKDIILDDFYPVNYRYSGDWFFWVNVFMKGKVAFVSKPLNTIRVHNLSVTQNSRGMNIHKLYEDVRVINHVNKRLNLKTGYNSKYSWIIDFWISVLKNRGGYFKKPYHDLDLPFSFKLVFYKRYFPLLLKKAVQKIVNK